MPVSILNQDQLSVIKAVVSSIGDAISNGPQPDWEDSLADGRDALLWLLDQTQEAPKTASERVSFMTPKLKPPHPANRSSTRG